MYKGILLAAAAVLGATGCDTMKKSCTSCGSGGNTAMAAKTAPAAGMPATAVVNGPAGSQMAMPDYSGRTVNGPAGSSATIPNYSQALGANPGNVVR